MGKTNRGWREDLRQDILGVRTHISNYIPDMKDTVDFIVNEVLSSYQRQLILMKYKEGMTKGQISKATCYAEKNISGGLTKAMDRLHSEPIRSILLHGLESIRQSKERILELDSVNDLLALPSFVLLPDDPKTLQKVWGRTMEKETIGDVLLDLQDIAAKVDRREAKEHHVQVYSAYYTMLSDSGVLEKLWDNGIYLQNIHFIKIRGEHKLVRTLLNMTLEETLSISGFLPKDYMARFLYCAEKAEIPLKSIRQTLQEASVVEQRKILDKYATQLKHKSPLHQLLLYAPKTLHASDMSMQKRKRRNAGNQIHSITVPTSKKMYDELRKEAKEQGLSVNSLVNLILHDFSVLSQDARGRKSRGYPYEGYDMEVKLTVENLKRLRQDAWNNRLTEEMHLKKLLASWLNRTRKQDATIENEKKEKEDLYVV